MSDERDLIDVGQAAGLLGVKPGWLRRCADRIGLPEYRSPAGYRKYRIKDVKEAALRIATRKLLEATQLQQAWQ